MAANKSFRISKLEAHHVATYTKVTASAQTIAAIAAQLGISFDDAEKRLSLLVDEGLAVRTSGGRTTATYVLA